MGRHGQGRTPSVSQGAQHQPASCRGLAPTVAGPGWAHCTRAFPAAGTAHGWASRPPALPVPSPCPGTPSPGERCCSRLSEEAPMAPTNTLLHAWAAAWGRGLEAVPAAGPPAPLVLRGSSAPWLPVASSTPGPRLGRSTGALNVPGAVALADVHPVTLSLPVVALLSHPPRHTGDVAQDTRVLPWFLVAL